MVGNVGFSVSNFNATFNSLSQVSLGQVNTASFAAISDGFQIAGGVSFDASFFANLPPMVMPRPPMHSVSLAKAAFSMDGFMGSISQFGVSGGFGYEAFMGMQAMNAKVSSFLGTQDLYGTASMSKLSMSMDMTVTTPGAKRITKDEFGTGLGAGKGHTSNLANSPEVVLALHNELKGKKFIKMEDLQKTLKDKYGIESKLEKVNGRKTLKFANGDNIKDANGNGGLDMNDYKFKGAVDSIKQKYGLTDDQIKAFGTKEGKQALGSMANQRIQSFNPQTHHLRYQMDAYQMNSNWMGSHNSFLSQNSFDEMFAMAMFYAKA